MEDFQSCKNAFIDTPQGLCVYQRERLGWEGGRTEQERRRGKETEKDKRLREIGVPERLKKLSTP